MGTVTVDRADPGIGWAGRAGRGGLPAGGGLRYSHRAGSACTAARPGTTEASGGVSVIAPARPARTG
jgi:hypothetical protein